jgi:hypothetical protein
MSASEQLTKLCKLSDTDFTVANPDEDIRGWAVVDKDGEEIGEVDDLLVDNRETKVRFLQVTSGGLGLGTTKFLPCGGEQTDERRDGLYQPGPPARGRGAAL